MGFSAKMIDESDEIKLLRKKVDELERENRYLREQLDDSRRESKKPKWIRKDKRKWEDE